jgi:hypothetical protein
MYTNKMKSLLIRQIKQQIKLNLLQNNIKRIE